MENPINSVTRLHSTHLLFIVVSVLYISAWPYKAVATTSQELLIGFKATPDPSVSKFQHLLNDSTSTFSLGFFRVNQIQLALTIIHLPSLEPLWQANPRSLAHWSGHTQVFFNGSLVMTDPRSGVFWSTQTQGDRVALLNTSNLQILKVESSPSVLWQSFNFPTNTLVENQNFTSIMTLVSSNGLYSLSLGDNFMALYAKFNDNNTNQMYWKHKALEAKAEIVDGQGPIYARINSDGYLGMYQNGNAPVDVQAFNSFNRPVDGFLLVRLEPDGNLKAYYWNGINWILDYQAISDTCKLPSPCGSYGLCRPGSGCSCLDNGTEFLSNSGGCLPPQSGDFCLVGESKSEAERNKFSVLRRKGVELPFKELMSSQMASSLEQCESFCDDNCTCWGAVYNNGTGFCYLVDYPIQTILGVGDESKIGYFKVKQESKKKKTQVGLAVGLGILGGAIVILIGAIGFGGYWICKRRRGVKRILEEENGVGPCPYKDLGSASFRSIEMCNSR